MKNQNKKTNNRLPVFYIALCCCVLAIGVAGYVSDSLSADEVMSISEDTEIFTPEPTFTVTPIETPEPTEAVEVFNEEIPEIPVSVDMYEDEEVFDYTYDNPDIAEVNAHVFDGFIMPLDGKILQPYSPTPYYNDVMCDWRTHNGIDIQAEIGREVIAAANGEIKEILTTVYGTQITISHNDGFETVYSQLEARSGLTEGSNIRCGDVIGTVTSSKGEPIKEPHLHFEVKHEGYYVNPTDFVSG